MEFKQTERGRDVHRCDTGHKIISFFVQKFPGTAKKLKFFNNKFRDDTNLHRYPSLFEMTHSNSKVVD